MRYFYHLAVYILFVGILGFLCPIQAQSDIRPSTTPQTHVTSSPAYAELLLRRTEVESELEAMVLEYTDEFPAVIGLKQQLHFIQKEIGLISKVKPADAGRLTLALGQLMVKRAELETSHWKLLSDYKEEHPDVRRAKRRIEIYDKAIKEILG